MKYFEKSVTDCSEVTTGHLKSRCSGNLLKAAAEVEISRSAAIKRKKDENREGEKEKNITAHLKCI